MSRLNAFPFQEGRGPAGPVVELAIRDELLVLLQVHEGQPRLTLRSSSQCPLKGLVFGDQSRGIPHPAMPPARAATSRAKSWTVLICAESSSVSLTRKRSSRPTARTVSANESRRRSWISPWWDWIGPVISSSRATIRPISARTSSSVGDATAKPRKKSRSVRERSGALGNQGAFFDANSNRQQCGVRERKHQRSNPGAVSDGDAEHFEDHPEED